jgi:hypothetical protein
MRTRVLFQFTIVLFIAQSGWADSGVDRIMQLRLEVEAKNNEWESKNKALQSTADALLQRIAELEAQNAKSKAGLALIRARLEAGEARLQRRQTLSASDRDRLLTTLTKAEAQFKTRLPFLSARALEETERIRTALLNKQSSTDEAAQAFAALLKNELKVARGLRFERVQIPFDDQRREVEVVRFGEYSAIAAVPDSAGDLSYRQIEVGRSDWRRLVAADDVKNVEAVFRAARDRASGGAPAIVAWPLRLGVEVERN